MKITIFMNMTMNRTMKMKMTINKTVTMTKALTLVLGNSFTYGYQNKVNQKMKVVTFKYLSCLVIPQSPNLPIHAILS